MFVKIYGDTLKRTTHLKELLLLGGGYKWETKNDQWEIAKANYIGGSNMHKARA